MLFSWAGRILRTREFGVVVVLILLVLFISSTEKGDAFLGPISLQNLSRQIALLGVFAIGQAVVIIAGGIDLSVGTLIGFTDRKSVV